MQPSIPTTAARDGILAGTQTRAAALAEARRIYVYEVGYHLKQQRNKLFYTGSYHNYFYQLRQVVKHARWNAEAQASLEKQDADIARVFGIPVGSPAHRTAVLINSLEMADFHDDANRAEVARAYATLASQVAA